MQTLLFLCTGNYYRSRFAEEYFNHLARQTTLPWRSYSRALLMDLSKSGNEGPISMDAKSALDNMHIDIHSADRFPISVDETDFEAAELIIALDYQEHQPMVMTQFPDYQKQVKYFNIGDLHIESPESALSNLITEIDDLTEELLSDLK